jgi:hypothetical protein
MSPLPEVIILVLVPLAPLFSHRVWPHAQMWFLGAILVPGPRTVAPVLRVMGLAMEQLCIMCCSLRFPRKQEHLVYAPCNSGSKIT